MKKLLAVLLALCLCLSLMPAALAAGMDEAELRALNHKIFEANQPDALYARHKSVSFQWHYTLDPSRDGFVYETADSQYQEWSNTTAQYIKDGVIYKLNWDENGSELIVGTDFSRKTDNHHYFVGQVEEEVMDYEHERVTGIYTEDGLTHILTQFDETLSKEWGETYLGAEYAGQTIRSEAIVDAESYEGVAILITMDQDGENRLVLEQTMEYDAPEPVACRSLRAAFERESEHMMTLTFVFNPGTDHEWTKSITVPQNMDSAFFTGGELCVAFDDPEGTTVTHWDRVSDHTWYIFTNPDQELVDRYYAQLALLRGEEPAAAETQDTTVKALMEANSLDAILSRHENVLFLTDDGSEKGWTVFASKDLAVDLSYGDACDASDNWSFEKTEDGLKLAYTWFVMGDAEREAMMQKPAYMAPTLNGEMLPLEKVTDVDDNKDGTLTVTLTMSAEDFAAAQEALGSPLEEEYRGAEDRIILVVDAKTMEVHSVEEYVVVGSKATPITATQLKFDVEQPEEAAQLAALIQEFRTKDHENPRTITIVYDAGTDREESYSITVGEKFKVYPILRDGYDISKAYLDAEKTQPFTGSDGVSDITLYAFAE